MKKYLALGLAVMAFGVMPVSARLGDPDPQVQWLEQRQQLRVENRQTVRAAAENAQLVRERVRETFRNRLQLIKDQRKKALTEKMNNRVCEVNQNRVEVMNRHLDKMLEVLVRIENRANTEKAAGKDITKLTAAISAARTAITEARTAVEAQSQVACELTISGDEARLGTEVSAAINKLHTQLQLVFEKVIKAREACKVAVSELARVLGEKVGGEDE